MAQSTSLQVRVDLDQENASYSSLYLVAIAYLMQKTPYVFPIIGGRKVEHLIANLEALNITLTTEQIKYLEGVVPFELGFPHSITVRLFSDG